MEASVSTKDVSSDTSSGTPGVQPGELRLESVSLGVADVDRATSFYQKLGWRQDADIKAGDLRVVQFTPPGAQCSIRFGENFTEVEPGAIQDLLLAVYDIDAAREELIRRGVKVSEPFHYAGVRVGPESRIPGPDPEGRSYFTHASFSDPDDNGWLLQEIKQRLPGR
jgi:catechol 2,3-dioxygenase-like lactoylglutathione lyase family enzyme